MGRAQGGARRAHETGSLVGAAPGPKAAEARIRAPSGACFLWFLSLHEQRKKPACGAGNRKLKRRRRRLNRCVHPSPGSGRTAGWAPPPPPPPPPRGGEKKKEESG